MDDIIAWLVPTTPNSLADKATYLPHNTPLTALPALAIALTFSHAPKRPGRITIGSNPLTCDVVLPALGTGAISPQHCALRYDASARLVLDDTSRCGTQVWFDWESCGDRADFTWLLERPAQRVVVDIQGARFQIIVNDARLRAEVADAGVADEEAFRRKVDAFSAKPAWSEGLSLGWDRASVTPVPRLFDNAPMWRHIVVKTLGERPAGEVYLWNVAKPWEPMVKAAA